MKTICITAAVLLAAASLASAETKSGLKESVTIGGKTISIAYSAPAVNGRVGKLFGKDGQVGKDPTYPVWRAGANAATALHTDAEKKLAKMVEELAGRGISAKYVVGTANDTGMEILRVADHNHADLIVIATHGLGGWRQLAFGSVAEKVVRLSSLPVLVMRAQS